MPVHHAAAGGVAEERQAGRVGARSGGFGGAGHEGQLLAAGRRGDQAPPPYAPMKVDRSAGVETIPPEAQAPEAPNSVETSTGASGGVTS
ncbi:hypothetical protein GCM10025734_66560 [Kitasatospora paranensis]